MMIMNLLQLSIKYFPNLCLVPKLCLIVSKVQTALALAYSQYTDLSQCWLAGLCAAEWSILHTALFTPVTTQQWEYLFTTSSCAKYLKKGKMLIR